MFICLGKLSAKVVKIETAIRMIALVLLTVLGLGIGSLEQALAIQKIETGFLSGSFDPPHLGHKDLIETALRDYPLKKLYILVHSVTDKDYNASATERAEMLRMMLASHASRVVIAIEEPISTSEKIASIMAKEKLKIGYRIIGEDSFEEIPMKEVENQQYHWVVMIRNELFPIDTIKKYQGLKNVEWNNNIVKGKSSTAVREKLLSKQNVLNDVDKEVARYIRSKKLYIAPSDVESAAKKEKYESAYQAYVQEIKKLVPAVKTMPSAAPAFIATQSSSAWRDRFMKLAIATNTLSKADAQIVFQWTMKKKK